jgi:hypothetical protein
MPYTPHATWVAGDIPVAADLNNWENGIEAAHIMADLAGLGAGRLAQTAGGPSLLLHLWRKASAFTFGSSPVTSDGYLRTPGGGPWGADGISGRPFDRVPDSTTVATGTTPNTLVLDRLFLLPAFADSFTVSRVDVQAQFGFARNGYSVDLDKVGLQVVRIAADGTESNIGSEAVNSTTAFTASDEFQIVQRYLSSPGLSQAIAATERLGFRLKLYGHNSDAGGGFKATVCLDVSGGDFSTTSGGFRLQLTGTPVAIWFT